MRKKILYTLLLLSVTVAKAQTSTENYIKTTLYKIQGVTTTNMGSVADADKIETIVYYDGLGRPMQQIAGKASGVSGTDIVTHIEYDLYGRQAKSYLPYKSTTADLSFITDAKTATEQYYSTDPEVEHTANYYSQTAFEASPLNRVLKQAAPGDAWAMAASGNNDHTIKYAYLTNTTNDAVKKLRAVATWSTTDNAYSITYANDGTYPLGELYKTITQNENKTGDIYITASSSASLKLNTIEEYRNKKGQLILKRTFNSKKGPSYETLDTYYVYDQYGNLTYVLQPLANGTFSTASLDRYIFQYRYDSRNRLVEKKIPGKQWEYVYYDPQDRAVATGPAFSPFGGTQTGWNYTVYDIFGRVALTGWIPENSITSLSRKNQQDIAVVNNASRGAGSIDGITVNYTTLLALPTGFKLLTVTYYDDYLWLDTPSQPTSSTQVEGEYVRLKVKGMATGSWIRTLTTESVTGESSYTFYDKKGRPIRMRANNYLGGYTQIDSKMRFDPILLSTNTKHKRTASDIELTIIEGFSYSAQDKLLNHTHRINSLDIEPLAGYSYNELGNVTQKAMGGTGGAFPTPLQYVDYKYNIRGWLTEINDVTDLDGPLNSGDDLFAFKIGYNTTADDSSVSETPLYNGNISETYWRSGSDNIKRKYSYDYDPLNRLANATYQKPGEPLANSYNESVEYDKNGNITSLKRNGGLDDYNLVVEIDNLAYAYVGTGNKLRSVTDLSNSPQGFNDVGLTSDDYAYDNNGNVTMDKNKNITAITYNHMNLPTEILFGSSTKKISYLYDAAGVKLKKTVTDGTNIMIMDYVGGFQYKGTVLQFFPTTEGYVENTRVGTTDNFNYVYQYKDHLGNVRMDFVAFQAVRNGPVIATIKEENHYYAFGMKHMNYNMNELEYQAQGGDVVLLPPPVTPTGKLPNNYLYNSKEYQDELALNIYDYGARNYDPAIGRFMNMDPLAETSRRVSPYAYALNNPVYFIDPDGMEAVGADGFTSSQWVEASKPNANHSLGTYYKEGNRRIEVIGKKLDGEVDKAYGKEDADHKRIYPLSTQVIIDMIFKLPTLRDLWNELGGKVAISFIDLPNGPESMHQEGVTDTRKRDATTDELLESEHHFERKPYIHLYRNAFSSYRNLAHTLLHEFGHGFSYTTGWFKNNLKKYETNAYYLDEVFAFHFAWLRGGDDPQNISWYIKNKGYVSAMIELNIVNPNIFGKINYNVLHLKP